MKSRGGRTWKEIGRTELLENTLDPEWSKAFLLDYYFEEKQVSELTILIIVFTSNCKDVRNNVRQKFGILFILYVYLESIV